jgi:menaquinone-specific isochorismate synthase
MPLSDSFIQSVRQKIALVTDSFGVIDMDLPALIDPLLAASSASIAPLIYFSTPKNTHVYLAVGAWRIVTHDQIPAILQSTTVPLRWFGARSFLASDHSQDTASDYWVLPLFWMEWHGDKGRLKLVADTHDRTCYQVADTLLDALTILFESSSSLAETSSYDSLNHTPGLSEWVHGVQTAQELMTQGALKKVVLARKTTFEFDQSLNPFLMLRQVQTMDNRVYNFCVKIDADHAFIGGTPERLFELNGRTIVSEAIAGTLFKSATENVLKQKASLMASQKNMGEHQYVVDFISNAMIHLCHEWAADTAPSLIELTYLLHLLTHFKGELREGMDWLDCLMTLHPTPAVAGVPTIESKAYITQFEPFDRGWYAGPMGMISRDYSCIVVAIRSGYVVKNTVALMAGAGIVPESIPLEEWHELDAKINLFSTIFGGRS